MTSKKEYLNKCFSPNWIEIDLNEIEKSSKNDNRVEERRRKDLNTLLNELNEIKQCIEKAAEKQHRLANLRGFYTGKFAQ